jgi:integrase
MGDMGFQVRIKYKVPTAGYGWIKEPSDVGRFLAACRPPWFRIAAALAVYAGLRRGEVAGLRRDALDFERGLIRLDRSFEGPVKSKRVRWVPLGPELASILRPWLLEHPGPMVVTRNDAPLDEKPDLAQFTRRACRRAGVDPVNFHQLRHSFASHLAQRVPLSIVGAVLGHADPRTTARYAHLDPESLARDPKLHLSFAAPAGEVIPFEPGATAARPKAK